VRAVQGWTTEVEWAETALDEAIAIGDRRFTAHARVQQGLLRLFTASAVEPTSLIRIAEETIRVFEELDDELGLARGWRLIAQAQYLARRAGLSTEASQRALEHARRAGDRFEQREIVEWLAVTLALGPTPAPEAARACERLLDELPEDSVLEAIVLGSLWYLRAIQEQPDRALPLGQRARRKVDEARGELIWLFPASLAWIALFRSEPSAAEQELRPVYDQLRNIGEKSHFSSCAMVLAQAVYAQGRYDEAEQIAREAEEASRPNDVHSQIIWRATMAKILAQRDEFEAAEQLARDAVAFAEQSDFLHSHADARIDLAEVLRLAGRREDAAEEIRAAVVLHEQKGNTLGAAQARVLLEELAS
jgi:ATP/maltotriose-dependent transcriptional regulator MalT